MKQRKSANDFFLDKDRKTSQGYVDIKKLTIEQLDELILRQNKLLQNRSFMQKLPDKGNRILFFKCELEIQRKKKQEEFDETCQLMLGLSLNEINAEELEWKQGKVNACKKQFDSDDDDGDDGDDGGCGNDDNLEKGKQESTETEINPLKLLATHSGTANGKYFKINSSESKVYKKGQKEVKKSYVEKFCEKYGKSSNGKERFKPNQFKNNDKTLFVTSAEQVKKKLGNKWEVTQAIPPVPIYKNVVMISLSESLKLQKEQVEKVKEIERKYAVEKLAQNMSLKMGNKLPFNNTTEYRNTKNFFEASGEDDENKLSDSDSEDKENIVNFHANDNRLNS